MAKKTDISEEEAVKLRDQEISEYYQDKIIKDAKGKPKVGANGKPLLEDTATFDDSGKLKSGYQITLNN